MYTSICATRGCKFQLCPVNLHHCCQAPLKLSLNCFGSILELEAIVLSSVIGDCRSVILKERGAMMVPLSISSGQPATEGPWDV